MNLPPNMPLLTTSDKVALLYVIVIVCACALAVLR